jgi:hypothetical protein
MEEVYKNLKKEILPKLNDLDKKSETHLLSQGEKELKLALDTNLKKLLREEELKWR